MVITTHSSKYYQLRTENSDHNPLQELIKSLNEFHTNWNSFNGRSLTEKRSRGWGYGWKGILTVSGFLFVFKKKIFQARLAAKKG